MRKGFLARPAICVRPCVRTLLALLLLCSVVWAQTSTLAEQHDPNHTPDHCCVLCHAGALPFLQTAAASAPIPVLILSGAAHTPDFNPAHDVPLAAASSRAPPVA
jgi:hypothetical protein